jgi:NADPH-dependent 2,4-dienoyl-CoA reductase/sulfur reductase-like enzyme
MTTIADVLVIGAGPAGLAAARAARARGAAVTLVDGSDQLGGQYWRHLPPSRPARNEGVLHHGWGTFRALADALESDAGCRILTQAHVFALEQRGDGPAEVHVVVGESDGADRSRIVLRPDAIVLATGAYDRTLPFPGWDLPGVFTGGSRARRRRRGRGTVPPPRGSVPRGDRGAGPGRVRGEPDPGPRARLAAEALAGARRRRQGR